MTKNNKLKDINTYSTDKIVETLYLEYKKSVKIIEKYNDEILKAVDFLENKITNNQKIFICGASYLGKIITIEVCDMLINYNLPIDIVQNIVSGEGRFLTDTQKEPDDKYNLGKADVTLSFLKENDILIALCAPENIQYIKGAVDVAKNKKANVILINNSDVDDFDCDIEINLPSKKEKTLSELISKTTFQIILKIMLTSIMVKLGKFYNDYLTDFKITNNHTKEFAIDFVSKMTNKDKQTAQNTLEQCKYRIKIALVMLKFNVDLKTAIAMIKNNRMLLENNVL